MSQSSSFGINDNDYYNSLAMDSPVAHSRNFSRFSRLADRSRSFFNNSSSIGMTEDQSVTPNQISVSDFIQAQVSPINSNKLNLSQTLQLPQSSDTDHITEDEMARLAIFESFFELNQKFQQQKQTSIDIFQLMDFFEKTCSDNLFVTKRLLENKLQSEYQLNYLNQFLHLIRLERNVWCLLKVLLGDRFASINNDFQQPEMDVANNRIGDMEIEENMNLRLSDSELIARSMERNSMLREMQIIIDWLESVNVDEEDGLPSLEKMDFYSDGPGYWENTLHHLMNQNRLQGNNSIFTKSSKNLCTEMDPDGPIRNGQPLHDLDKEDENRLFHYLFKLVRSGKLPEGKSIAERFGYFWLSAALEGWIYYHDPNYNEPIVEQPDAEINSNIMFPSSDISRMSIATQYSNAITHLTPIEGNPNRDLWKLSAWKCSQMVGTSLYERAIFAVFSGNRSVLMPICTKWMDKLWAYFKCSLDVHLENLLIDTNISKPDMQPRINVELPDSYWDNRLTPEEIFLELETQSNFQTSTYLTRLEEDCYRSIVKDVVLSKIDSLIENLFAWSQAIQTKRENRSKPSQEPRSSWNKLKDTEEELMTKMIEPNLLRLFAHIVICLKELNLVSLEKHLNLCVEILEIYIGFLIEYKLVELIAFYTSFLPETKQVRTFATLLETIEDESDRRLCLIIAKNAKLNLPAILSLVVENIRLDKTGYQLMISKMIPHANFGNFGNVKVRNDSRTKAGQLLSTAVTEDDIRKINALDWLLLDGDNPQYLELLWQVNALIRKFMLEQKIDQALEAYAKLPSDIVNRAYQEWKQSDIDFGFEIENVVREYLSHSSYFEASEAFKKWHHFLYTTKPREPAKPKVPITRIADRVLYEQRLKQYEQDLEIWRSQITIQSANTSKKLLAFLCFPDGIWIDLENCDIIHEINDEQLIERQMETDQQQQNRFIYRLTDSESILSTEIALASEDYDENEADDNNVAIVSSKERELVIKQQVERKRNEWQKSRPNQLEGLRRIYVPQFVFLLHSVYKDSGDLKQCIRVSDLLADENQRLHQTFTPEQLADFLAKIREVSIEILNYTSDPFGCDIEHH